jgi:sulfotransferase
MERTIHFLSGLPRTGSTLLGSILAQNPCVHVTPTSPLCPLIMDLSQRLDILAAQHTFDVDTFRDKLFASVPTLYFEEFDKPFIFDKNRFWPEHVEAIKRYINPEPRVVATIRPIAEIVTSWIKLCNRTPDNFIDNHIKTDGHEVNNDNRASLIWQKYLAHTHGMLSNRYREVP